MTMPNSCDKSIFDFINPAHHHYNIEELIRIPANVYWKDLKGVHLGCNEYTTLDTGLSSVNDYIGLTIFDISENERAKIIQQTDKQVMKSGLPHYLVESSGSKNSSPGLYISVKAPLLNKHAKVHGLIGISFRIENLQYSSIASSLTNMQFIHEKDTSNNLILNHSTVNYLLKHYSLTKKETEILLYLCQGKSAKEIAKIITISHRTVETHTEHIKEKLDCHSKYQLLDKIHGISKATML